MKYRGIKKLYYSISEISDMLDIKQSVIRYWETEFKELKPQKNRAGNRIFKKEDIGLIRLIDYYVHGKHLSIQEAGEMIRDLKNEGLYERKLQEIMPADDDEHDEDMADSDENKEESRKPFADDEEDVRDEEGIDMTPEPDEEDREQKKEHEETPDDNINDMPGKDQSSDSAETATGPLIKDPGEADEEALTFPAEEEEVEPIVQQQSEKADEEAAEKYEKQIRQYEEEQKAMRELLTKISGNIRDIINILNESVQ